jgi:hypothetical protein
MFPVTVLQCQIMTNNDRLIFDTPLRIKDLRDLKARKKYDYDSMPHGGRVDTAPYGQAANGAAVAPIAREESAKQIRVGRVGNYDTRGKNKDGDTRVRTDATPGRRAAETAARRAGGTPATLHFD